MVIIKTVTPANNLTNIANSEFKILPNPNIANGAKLITAAELNNEDTYRPISYSDTMKNKAKQLSSSGNKAADYYLWQDDPNAVGSAAWAEKKLKQKGIDLSTKTSTGNAVVDNLAEFGKGIISWPLDLKRTLAAGTLGAVALTQTPINNAGSILTEGAAKAVSTTIETAKDNPARFAGAVVGSVLTTKGIGKVGGKLSAVPKTTKIVRSKNIEKTSSGITKNKTVSVISGNKTKSLTIQKQKTNSGTNKTTTIGVINNKTGTGKAIQIIKNKSTTITNGDGTINPIIKSKKVVVNESGIKIKAIKNNGVIKESRKAKKTETTITKLGTDKAKGIEVNKRIETRKIKNIGTADNNKTTGKGRRTENITRKLTTDGKTETKKYRTTKSLGGKAKAKGPHSKSNFTLKNKENKNRNKTERRYFVNGKPVNPKGLTAIGNVKGRRTNRTLGVINAAEPYTIGTIKAADIPIIGTIRIKQTPKTKPNTTNSGYGSETGKSARNSNSSSKSSNGSVYEIKTEQKQQQKPKQTKPDTNIGNSGNGMVLETKTKPETKKRTNRTFQTANILKGNTTKTASTKIKGVVISTPKQDNRTKKTTKTNIKQTIKESPKTIQSTDKTTKQTKTIVRKPITKEKTKEDTKRAAVIAITHATVKRSAVKPIQSKKRKKALIHTPKRPGKNRKRIPDDDYFEKKLKQIKTKRPKNYRRTEIKNYLSWIDDNTPLMKAKRITK